MSYLWPNIELESDSSDDGSSDEVIKYQKRPDNKEQEYVISIPRRNPRRIRRGDKISLRHLKSEIKISKDKLFFIKHTSAGSTQAKWYLIKVDMDQSDLVDMSDYGV